MGQAVIDGFSEVMNVIVQMDKEEFDIMQKQAAHNMDTLQELAVNTAWNVLDGLVKVLREHPSVTNTNDKLAEFLANARSKYGFEVLSKVNAQVEHEPPFIRYPRNA